MRQGSFSRGGARLVRAVLVVPFHFLPGGHGVIVSFFARQHI